MGKIGNAFGRVVEMGLRIIDPHYDRMCGRAEALQEAGPHDPAELVGGAAKLTQEPAENCCPATVTTFKGLTLECEFDPGHTGLHLDVDQGILWAHSDEMTTITLPAPKGAE